MSTPTIDLYQFELNYQTDAESLGNLLHKMRLWARPKDGNASPGASPSATAVETKNGVGQFMDLAVAQWGTAMLPIMPAQAQLGVCDIFLVLAGQQQRTYITSVTIGAAGTNVNNAVAASQTVYTARTQSGSIIRPSTLENGFSGSSIGTWTSASPGGEGAWFDFFNDGTAWACDRFGSYVIAGYRRSRGQNEAIWRKRFRL